MPCAPKLVNPIYLEISQDAGSIPAASIMDIAIEILEETEIFVFRYLLNDKTANVCIRLNTINNIELQ